MKYLDEYRDPIWSEKLVASIRRTATRSWTLMEVCGGQTHTLLRSGIDQLLQGSIRLLHGPGCPVCVTPLVLIDRAQELAARREVIFCSFGDMLRVPGSQRDLLRIRAEGADVRIVYSPLDAVRMAIANPTREVIFFAVGFETTAPATALAAWQARQLGLKNFSLLVAHVLVPPALEALLNEPGHEVQGLLAPGHVCTITGYDDYHALATRYKTPIVVTGFEPVDLLEGIALLVRQLEEGSFKVENQYCRAVHPQGNPSAQHTVSQVYEICDRPWRGIGTIPRSGLRLREEFREFDAEARFPCSSLPVLEDPECLSGAVLQGRLRPDDCPAFGTRCTPDHPLGAPMVSEEGACAAYRKYRSMGVATAS